VIGYDPRPDVTDVPTLASLAKALTRPPVVGVRVPSGPITDETSTTLAGVLSSGDVVIGGCNSHYTDDGLHPKLLVDKGIAYIDAGVSGGIWGLTEGYGLMVGGSGADVERAMPIDSGEGRGTVEEAVRLRAPVPGIAASLFARFLSRQDDSPTMKAVAALSNQFGGHAVQRTSESG
jgi:6-phosphogluconate dehydrogenase (decarboxylating)